MGQLRLWPAVLLLAVTASWGLMASAQEGPATEYVLHIKAVGDSSSDLVPQGDKVQWKLDRFVPPPARPTKSKAGLHAQVETQVKEGTVPGEYTRLDAKAETRAKEGTVPGEYTRLDGQVEMQVKEKTVPGEYTWAKRGRELDTCVLSPDHPAKGKAGDDREAWQWKMPDAGLLLTKKKAESPFVAGPGTTEKGRQELLPKETGAAKAPVAAAPAHSQPAAPEAGPPAGQ
jgi:hypothetical protein